MGSCARNFGLGKAVVLHAMHHMQAAGMAYATVANSGTNEAFRALYKACGFEPWHMIDNYVKPKREDGRMAPTLHECQRQDLTAKPKPGMCRPNPANTKKEDLPRRGSTVVDCPNRFMAVGCRTRTDANMRDDAG